MQALLNEWQKHGQHHSQATHTSIDDIIARMTYHTLMIYLHTIFSADSTWQKLNIVAPVLGKEALNEHVKNLFQMVDSALTRSTTCPIVFLFPLFVAANAVKNAEEGQHVRNLLERIRSQYCVIAGEAPQVLPFWTPSDAFQGKDLDNKLLRERRGLVLRNLQLASSGDTLIMPT